MGIYAKFIAAALSFLVSLGLFTMDEATMGIIAQGIGAILVYILPNKTPNAG
jgi:hypothetical protein